MPQNLLPDLGGMLVCFQPLLMQALFPEPARIVDDDARDWMR